MSINISLELLILIIAVILATLLLRALPAHPPIWVECVVAIVVHRIISWVGEKWWDRKQSKNSKSGWRRTS
jgi:di/tricarboxylate transporter